MYDFTQLFWYKLIFMAELIVAESLFSFRLKKRSFFILRLIISLILCFAFAFAVPIISYDATYGSIMFLVLFLFTVGALKFIFKESMVNIIFVAIAGYTTQHIAYEFYDFLIIAFNLNNGNPLNIYGNVTGGYFANPLVEMAYFVSYAISYWLLFILFANRIKRNEELQIQNFALFSLMILIVIIDIVLSSLITYYSYEKFDDKYMMFLCVFNVLCCFLALFIQFELSLRKKLEKEILTMNQLWSMEKKQYYSNKENINLINLKCHDLKHQIRKIANTNSLSKDTIKEIENVISIYDSNVKTENEVLDIILTEKSLLCNKNNIKLTCIVDGKKLNFMSEEDLYSLFGNAIDNAIEAVTDLEVDKRIIGLSVKSINSFLSINVHNYFDKDLSFENGLPKTTKEDKSYHGFGMQSIKQICEKYNGDISINTSNHIFNLNILFPLD